MCFATTLSIAKKMISYGIDSIVLEGNEAGGHIGPVSINVLVQEILQRLMRFQFLLLEVSEEVKLF